MKLAVLSAGLDPCCLKKIEETRRKRGLAPLSAHAEIKSILPVLTPREQRIYTLVGNAGINRRDRLNDQSLLDRLALAELQKAGLVFSVRRNGKTEYVVPREAKTMLTGERQIDESEKPDDIFTLMNALVSCFSGQHGNVENDVKVKELLKRFDCDSGDIDMLVRCRFDDLIEEYIKSKREAVGDSRFFTGRTGVTEIMDLGNMEWLVPLSTQPGLLFELLLWGETEGDHADSEYITVVFNRGSVRKAVQTGRTVESFIRKFEKALSDSDSFQTRLEALSEDSEPGHYAGSFEAFRFSAEEVLAAAVSLLSENNISFTRGGGKMIFVESAFKADALKLLKAKGMINGREDHNTGAESPGVPGWVCADPPFNEEALTEAPANLPRQWYSLTSYKPQMLLRLVRQAFVLGLPLSYTDSSGTAAVTEISNLTVKGEARPFFCDDTGERVYLEHIHSAALVSPAEAQQMIHEGRL
ncbi:hypothetical protein [Alteribacter natronophilus]|uniref:hypothetical protein n=1 Tax=Alteribacter natronophilus TaxID=2583810 RepID=UPI00110E17DE|nr:hypothetical protein [Alteribacter natronophilus]TMW73100.1 hypothetical protein FGB90_01965 [Alteribacter natronophilus]